VKLPLFRPAAALLCTLTITACGGGVYIGWGPDDDRPPSVSLTAAVTSAAPGQSIRFVAAATDDFGVDSVALWRIERDGSAGEVSSDSTWPWEFTTTLPADAIGSVRYFARATDDVGQQSDSETVTVAVR
jgi:hypothetical protein